MSPYSRRSAATLAALMLLLLTTLPGFHLPGYAAPAHPPHTNPLLPPSSQETGGSSETADLLVVPIDPSVGGNEVLRSRPFILDWNTNPAYQIVNRGQPQISADEARAELARFLGLRQLNTATQTQVLDRFDDPEVTQIVAAPALRAALLMLSELDRYQAVVDSILAGANETGLPFAAVEFAELGVDNAVATIIPPSAQTGSRFRMQISSHFAGERPLHLIPAIVHESLHGDGENSSAEELIANILDTIAFAEVLLIDPNAVFDGTELAVYNNLQLYALLNSMGIRGGGHIGISTSVIGDVFVGPGLEDFDARSIRDSILKDPFYGSLGGYASPVSPTAQALIEHFPGQGAIGDAPLFDESLLALIDRGVSHIIAPDMARDLAVILGLSATAGSLETSGELTNATVLALIDRPFIPIRTDLFDLNQSRRPGNVTDERSMRLALLEALELHAPNANSTEQLALFDSNQLVERIPDHQLRAAVVLLASIEPWSGTADVLLEASGSGGSWTIGFAPLPVQVNALFELNERDVRRVLINQYLVGESLELTATAIVEGVLLEEERRTPNGAVVAALLSTIAWADLLEHRPDAAANLTWGTINRNVDLLALLNSTQWSLDSSENTSDLLGFLAPAGGAPDILPGLLLDASSFQSHVLNSSRVEGVENTTFAIPSELLLGLAMDTGISLPSGPAGTVIDHTAMLRLDSRIGTLLPAEVVATLLATLSLGVAA